MRWLSKPIEPLIQRLREDEFAGCTEVLVVGSGYGGSVAALRFAEAGFKVTLLERGAEYLAGDFPADLSQLGAFVRAEVGYQSGDSARIASLGYEDALFDFRLGKQAYALVAPPLYAPLRFANVDAQEVISQETICWPEGQAIVNTKAWNGQGWLECELHQDDQGGLKLNSEFRLQAFDEAQPRHFRESWQLS